MGLDIKGGGAVQLALGIRPQRCYSGIRSAKKIAIWAWIRLQPCLRSIHFFVMSIMAGYIIFSRLPSVEKTDLPWSHLLQLAVEAFHDVGGVNQPAYLLEVLETGAVIDLVEPP